MKAFNLIDLLAIKPSSVFVLMGVEHRPKLRTSDGWVEMTLYAGEYKYRRITQAEDLAGCRLITDEEMADKFNLDLEAARIWRESIEKGYQPKTI